MPKRRANGEGNIRKRKDGRWEGRYTAGYDANGKAITKNVLGRTQAEVKEKLRTVMRSKRRKSADAPILLSRSVHKLQRTLRIMSLTSLTGCIATLRIWRGSVRIRPSARCTLLCM